MSLFDKLRHLGTAAAAELASAHTRTQVARFVRLALFALLAQFAATGGADFGWKTLAALAVGAAESAFRAVWPAFPADAVVNAVKGAITNAPAQASAATSSLTPLPVTSAASLASASTENATAAATPPLVPPSS